MNISIHKHNLVIGKNDLRLYDGAEILCVKSQFNTPVLYTKHDSNELLSDEYRTIWGFCTGSTSLHSKVESLKYIGTVMTMNDAFIVHFFEEIKNEKEQSS